MEIREKIARVKLIREESVDAIDITAQEMRRTLESFKLNLSEGGGDD